MEKGLEVYIKQFPTFIKLQSTQLAEPLTSHTVLYSPRHKVGADFMDLDKRYLIITDYFSNCPFIVWMPLFTTFTVFGCLTELVSLKVSHLKVFTYNSQPSTQKQ